MAGPQPYKGNFYLWHYLPSIPLAATTAFLFLVVGLLQAYKVYKTKQKFCIAIVVGCFFEVIGYIIRISARNHTSQLMPYLLQNVFILIAPALFAASIYMTLGRVIRYLHAEHLSPIRVSWLTKVFLLCDWMVFMIQGNSASLTFKASTRKIGEGMIVAGLFLQIVVFGVFFITGIVFHLRVRRSPTNESLVNDQDWIRVMYMLYFVSVLILIRSIFRVVEYLMGYDGYLFVNEWPLYVFDAVLMWFVCVAFLWCWPSKIRVEKRYEVIELAERVRGWWIKSRGHPAQSH